MQLRSDTLRFLLILSVGLFFTTACDSKLNGNSKNENEEELLLRELEENFNKEEAPSGVLRKINEIIDTISEEEIRKQLFTLADKTALKIINNIDDLKTIRYIFEIEDIERLEDPENFMYFRFLSDNTREAVLKTVGYYITKNVFLNNTNLRMEFINEYDGVSVGEWRGNIYNILRENNSTYEDILSEEYTIVSVNDEIVIDLTDGIDFETDTVNRIFRIVDETGKPVSVQNSLNGYEEFISNEFKVFKEEKLELAIKYEEEREDSKTIRIGMDSNEVTERWGEPLDINQTITQYSTNEQWVYSGNRYLYFEDGILTAIQK